MPPQKKKKTTWQETSEGEREQERELVPIDQDNTDTLKKLKRIEASLKTRVRRKGPMQKLQTKHN